MNLYEKLRYEGPMEIKYSVVMLQYGTQKKDP